MFPPLHQKERKDRVAMRELREGQEQDVVMLCLAVCVVLAAWQE